LTRNPERHRGGNYSSSSLRRGRTLSARSLECDSKIEVKTLDCGRNHIAHISNENDIYTWGRSTHGRLGHGDIIEEKGISVPFRVEGLHMHGYLEFHFPFQFYFIVFSVTWHLEVDGATLIL